MVQKDPILIKIANGREIALKPLMIIGRQADCDLQLTEGHASRKHATLTLANGGAWIEDHGSANGTFVNGNRVAARTQLMSGDRLRFDVEEFDFLAPVAEAALDDNRTMFRTPDAVDALSSGVLKRPGAWADPDAAVADANRTRLIEPAQLKQMMSREPKTAMPAGDVIDGPHLQITSGSRSALKIRLTVGQSGLREWTVGSHADREVQLVDTGVSALHARIVNEGARWKVVDQMSANGTFVNDKRSNVSYLSSGDRIRFGPVDCIFHASAPAASSYAVRKTNSSTAGNKTLLIGAGAFAATLIVLFVVFKFFL
jgi:pSer/pThr/pTyr-binding forkhead associated (FHA) protein